MPGHDQTSVHARRAVRGDGDSLEWLVERFSAFVRAHARMRLGAGSGPHDVDDVVAEVWLILVQKLRGLTPRQGRMAPVLVRYLGTTTLQVSNNALRRRLRREHARGLATARGEPARDAGVEQHLAQTRGVVTRASERELSSRIQDCLDRMTEPRRQVLLLRLMEQRSNQEVATILDVSANTAAVRYRRAMQELRENLPANMFEEILGAAG